MPKLIEQLGGIALESNGRTLTASGRCGGNNSYGKLRATKQQKPYLFGCFGSLEQKLTVKCIDVNFVIQEMTAANAL